MKEAGREREGERTIIGEGEDVSLDGCEISSSYTSSPYFYNMPKEREESVPGMRGTRFFLLT